MENNRDACPTLKDNKAHWCVVLAYKFLPKTIFFSSLGLVLFGLIADEVHRFGFSPLQYVIVAFIGIVFSVIAFAVTREWFVKSHRAHGGIFSFPPTSEHISTDE